MVVVVVVVIVVVVIVVVVIVVIVVAVVVVVVVVMEVLAELRKDLIDFCSTTSIQGMRYVSDPNSGTFFRSIWFLIVVVSFTLSGICIKESFDGNFVI